MYSSRRSYGKSSKRRSKKSSRKGRRAVSLYRQPRLNTTGKFHRFKQLVSGSSLPAGSNNFSQAVADAGYLIYFRFSQLPQAASFAGLFDQYRITQVKLKLLPQKVFVVDASVGVSSPSGCIATCIDYDGQAAPPASLNQILEYETARVQQCHDMTPIIRTLKPRAVGGVYDATPTIQNGCLLENSQWLDMAQQGIAYYGMQLYIEAYASSNTAQTWRVFAEFTVEMKSVR